MRERLAPRTDQLVERLPDQVGEVVNRNREQVWDFLGIEAPKAEAEATSKTKTTSKAKAEPKAKTSK